jgi:hypothetical protein
VWGNAWLLLVLLLLLLLPLLSPPPSPPQLLSRLYVSCVAVGSVLRSRMEVALSFENGICVVN